jgi:hypothetical protein
VNPVPGHVSSVSNVTPAAAAAATQPTARPKSTEKPASGQALAQDSVKISTAGRAASQPQSPQKSSGDVDHDADGK